MTERSQDGDPGQGPTLIPLEQDQFLQVVDCETAKTRWREAAPSRPSQAETVELRGSLGRILDDDVLAPIDVPGFDRSNLDGYAVRAQDTFDASEDHAAELIINEEHLAPGQVPRVTVAQGTATPISTGGMLPRGADAIAMVEITAIREGRLFVRKPVTPGEGVTFAGTDMARGERILRRGSKLTSRETGVLAALGITNVGVRSQPRVAIVSTGNEITPPGVDLRLGSVHDANATILADAVRELGGSPTIMGIVTDEDAALDQILDRSLSSADLVILSGGTSKGAGDLSYRVLSRRSPGLVVHGVALKPGKPVCLGAVGQIPVAILPGFPTSAVFTFHEFVAPRIREMLGGKMDPRETLQARMAVRVNSDRGRREYLLVNLVAGQDGLVAYPMGKGSGSVTAFATADGFVTIPASQEFVGEFEVVQVSLMARDLAPSDLVVIGSHCVGLDELLGQLAAPGFTTKTLWVGSQGGLLAASRGECDLAGIHLLDPLTGQYNTPFLPEGVRLLEGYSRMQGLVTRPGEAIGESWESFRRLREEPDMTMVNRNRGSGTRILIDRSLEGARPVGYAVEARSHNAVCAAISQHRADWGVAIEPVARSYGLSFLPLTAERYDFAIPGSRWDRPAVSAFRTLLDRPETRRKLAELGFGSEPRS